MRKATGISALLHVTLIGVMYFGLPIFYDPAPTLMPPVIEVEFARLDDKTNLPAPEPEQQPEPKPEPPAKTAEPPPAIAKDEAPPPEPDDLEAEMLAWVEPDPLPEVTEPEPPKPEVKAVEIKPKPRPKALKRPPPKPKFRPRRTVKRPPKPKKTQPKFDANRLVAKLDKKLKDKKRRPKRPDEAELSAATRSELNVKPRLARPWVTISELDRIRGHIARNWNPNMGAPGIERMVVRIRIFLKVDGSLSRPPEIIAEDAAGQSEQVFRPFADSAVRAVFRSDPLPVPRDKYDAWREIEFTFSLKDMLG